MKHAFRIALLLALLTLCIFPAAARCIPCPSAEAALRFPRVRTRRICQKPDAPKDKTACDLGCGLCSGNGDCFSCPLCGPCFFTAIPSPGPTPMPGEPAPLETPAACPEQPRATPAPECFHPAEPTKHPTAKPSAAPTVRPAAKPTAQPTAKPTVRPQDRPTATPKPRPTARPAASPTAQPPVSTGDYTTLSVSAQEQMLLNLVNEDRAAHGLPPLALDPELSRLARTKACDMNRNGYFAHESPTLGNAAQMLTDAGYDFRGVGENIAHHATVEKAEAAFLSSDGHRRNIMGSQWDKIGIGVCIDSNGYVYVTQLFAR